MSVRVTPQERRPRRSEIMERPVTGILGLIVKSPLKRSGSDARRDWGVKVKVDFAIILGCEDVTSA